MATPRRKAPPRAHSRPVFARTDRSGRELWLAKAIVPADSSAPAPQRIRAPHISHDRIVLIPELIGRPADDGVTGGSPPLATNRATWWNANSTSILLSPGYFAL